MSIFGAMQSGISGLAAQSTAMGAVSDNIVNVNTVGYKGTNVAFQTLVTKQVSTSRYSPGGVQPATKQGVNVQGLLSSSVSSTALAVSGNGYFVVNRAANPGEDDMWAYTRAGDFDIDENGYLKNTGGFYAQGWSLLPWDKNPNATVVNINGIDYMKAYHDTDGKVVYINDNIIDNRNMRPINLTQIGGTATATKQLSFGANLPSGDPVYNPSNPDAGGRRSVSALIYDSLGSAHNLSLNYTKESSNSWGLSTSIPSGASSIVLKGSAETHGDASSDVYYAAGQLEFSDIPSNGSTISISDKATGKTYTFEFLTTAGAVAQPGNIAVDVSTGVVNASDFANKFQQALDEYMPDSNRFQLDGNKIDIVQSVTGGALTIDASKTKACIQSASNPNQTSGIPSGVFEIPELDEDIKNAARLDFNGTTLSDYQNQTVTVDGKTYEFTNGGAASAGNIAVDVSSAFVAGVNNPAASVATLLAQQIKNNSVEPERFVASGSTIEILPSSTGPDIVFQANAGAAISGRVRDASSGWLDVAAGTQYTLANTFNINSTEPQVGAIVPAVRFNADGNPKMHYVDEIAIQWANGALNMDGGYEQGTTITLNAGNIGTNDGLTSLNGTFNTQSIKQDGAKFGTYAGVYINESGIVTALFDNGETRPIAILPLATFANPNGMESLTGNSWIETDYSGQALLKQGGTAGAGKVSSNSLELSTVDLATEFSNMIITQRAYSAATKIITTADEMLDELTRLT